MVLEKKKKEMNERLMKLIESLEDLDIAMDILKGYRHLLILDALMEGERYDEG